MNVQRALAAATAAAILMQPPVAAWAQGEAALRPLFVKTMVVSDPPPTMARQFFGRVRARETVDLAFEVGGRLAVLDAVEGASVATGTLIAALDPDPFERAVERAELGLAQAERDLDRALLLADRNVASAVNAENTQTARDLAVITLRDARAALADARIEAPFDGMIADRIAPNRTIVEPGEPIARLHDMSELRIEVDLPERLVHRVRDLGQVDFTALLPGDDAAFELHFREFQAETGAVGQSYTLSLAASEDAPAWLLPGQTVIVRAAIPNPDPRPALPPGAIATTSDGRTYVVAVEARGAELVARHVDVEVGAPTGSALTVDGLPEDTEIVAVGAHAVPDGSQLARFAGLTRDTE